MKKFNKDIKVNPLPAVPNINVRFHQNITHLCNGKNAVIEVDEKYHCLPVCWIKEICARRKKFTEIIAFYDD